MKIVTLDVGSSAVKAAVFDGSLGQPTQRLSPIVRVPVETQYRGLDVQMSAEPLWRAVVAAIRGLGELARTADRVAIDTLCPGFCPLARDGSGGWRVLAPILTHQDRRSSREAADIEAAIGRDRHLKLVGCRPFPGGIASSSLLWLSRHHPTLLAQAEVFGMLTTFLTAHMTGGPPVIDPGSASFTGLFETFTAGEANRWSPELCAAVGVRADRLPLVRCGSAVAGRVRPAVAAETGLPAGAEVLTGVIDTTAAILSAGAEPGRLYHSIGTTDVLAIVTAEPRPSRKLLTRAFGVGRLYVTVNTIAAGGGTLQWVHRNLFADHQPEQFAALVRELAADAAPTTVRFRPYLAGDRLSLKPKTAGFSGLTMSTDRREMLRAVLAAWAELNAAGLARLSRRATPLPDVYTTGGGDAAADALHARWPGKWNFHYIQDATLSGLANLALLPTAG